MEYLTPEYEAMSEQLRGWRLFYGDGSTFDSGEGAWDEAPDDDVQVLMLYLEAPTYRAQIAGFDEYILPGGSSVKRGRLIEEESFYQIQAKAVEDYEWPD